MTAMAEVIVNEEDPYNIWDHSLTIEERKTLVNLLRKLANTNKSIPDVRNIRLYNPGGRFVNIGDKEDPRASGPWGLDRWRLMAVYIGQGDEHANSK